MKTYLLKRPVLSTSVVALAALWPEAPSFAEGNAASRIEAIEQQIRALNDELQRVRQDLAKQSGELKRSQDEVKAAREETRRVQQKAQQPADSAGPKITFPNGRPTISSADGRNSLAIGGVLHYDIGTYFQGGRNGTDTRPTAVRDLNSGENLRRARIGVYGKIANDWRVNVTGDFGGSPDGVTNSTYLYEANLNYVGIKPLTFTVGYFQPWFTLGDSTSSNDFLMMERPSIVEIARSLAAGDARSSAGVKASTDDYFVAAYLTGAAFGSQNGGLLNDQQTGGTFRAATRPLHGDDYNLHVGVSGSMVFHPNENASGIPGESRTTLQLRDRPELRIDQNRLIDTGALSASGADTYGIELAANWRNFLVQGEYMRIDVDQTKQPGALAPGLTFDGGYVEGSWVISGERRPYLPARSAFGSPTPAHPFALDGSGFGAFELAARYSYANLDDHVTRGVPQAATGGVFGGEQQIYSVGLNWYPVSNLRFMLDYYFTDVDRLDPTGRIQIGQRFQALAMRAQASF